jgi:hypothetical protein
MNKLPIIKVEVPSNYNETGIAHGSKLTIDGQEIRNLGEFSLTFPVGGKPALLKTDIIAAGFGTELIFEGPANVHVTIVAYSTDLAVVSRVIDSNTIRYTLEPKRIVV